MQDVVIISTARTLIAKAFRGTLNDLKSPSMSAIALCAAVERAGVETDVIGDLIMGAAIQSATVGINLVRLSVLAAGLPFSVSGQTIDRQCASGLMAIPIAAKQEIFDGLQVTIGVGQEQISLVPNMRMQLANVSTLGQRTPDSIHSGFPGAELSLVYKHEHLAVCLSG